MKQYKLIIPFSLFIAVATLIILLVAQITDFSRQVTDFYAPTIHGVKSFTEATHHVRMSMEDKGIPDQIAVFHLKDATEKLKKLSFAWDPDYRKHIESMLIKAEKLLSELTGKDVSREELLSDIRHLNEEAMNHDTMHEAELENARTGIEKSVSKIRIVALLILLTGAIFSFRELQLYRLKEREQEKLSAIKAFVLALEARDPYTKGHSVRVADYAVSIGKEMGIKKETLEHLNLAALMHDIGKMSISDSILRKTEKLNDNDWGEMKNHPVISAGILESFGSLKTIVPWVLYHHERFDGKGYPESKAGLEIPLPAQIIALADAFDAMTSARSYRQAMNLETVLSEIEKNNGIQWRSDVTSAFMQCVKKGFIKINHGKLPALPVVYDEKG